MPWFGREERTEPATPRRREEARRKGQVAKTRELPSALVILAFALFFHFYSSKCLQNMESFFVLVLSHLYIGLQGLIMFKTPIMGLLATVLLPFMVMVLAVALAANYFQVGWIFSSNPVTPQLSRIDPIAGLKRLVSPVALVEAIKALIKLAIVGFVTYKLLKVHLSDLVSLASLPAPSIGGYAFSLSMKLMMVLGMLFVGLSLLDYFYQRYEFESSIKMTKEEVKEEHKMYEGDPRVKARIRSLQRTLARTRMMEAVKEADVVITNPQHIAVALRYRVHRDSAPEVVAKGAGHIAHKIKEVARKYGVAIVENPPLARSLFKLEVGDVIPPALFKAVAEILAYVYKLKNRSIGV